jgi:hypothetical protein
MGGNSGEVTFCYTTCVVNGEGYAGGLIAFNVGGSVTNCYSTGDVSGAGEVGGLVGRNDATASITKCYSTGLVSGLGDNIGGLVGSNNGSWSHCFWDIDTSSTTDGVGNEDPDPSGVTGKTTAQMQTQSTFTGWDFTTPVWMMLREYEDYPRLEWQAIYLGDIAGLYGVDMVDFARLAGQWNEPVCDESNQWCQGADIDGSGDVGISDLAYLAQDWLK